MYFLLLDTQLIRREVSTKCPGGPEDPNSICRMKDKEWIPEGATKQRSSRGKVLVGEDRILCSMWPKLMSGGRLHGSCSAGP